MEEKSASVAHDLLIVQRAESLTSRILATLQRKGFALRTVKTAEDACSTAPNLVQPILLIYCGDQVGCAEYCTEFTARPELHRFPLLVLGKDVDGLEPELCNYFGFATTLRVPFNINDLLRAVRFIAREYKFQTAEERKRVEPAPIEIPPTESPPARVTQVLEDEEDVLLPSQSHALYSEATTVTSLLFQQLQSYKLFERSVGGGAYPRLSKEAHFDVNKILPSDQSLAKAVKDMTRDIGRWCTLHLYRCHFLVGKILEPLDFDPRFLQQAKSATLLFAYAFGRKNRSLLRAEYSGRGTLLLRKELCSLIKDSALQIATSLRQPETAELVATIGRLIGREEVVSDECRLVIASSVMASDLVDRICFQSGNWNPRAAYSLVRKIKSGRLRDFHPAVLCCLVKLLTEAVTEAPPAYLVSGSIRKNPELKAQAQETKSQQVSEDEAKVDISSLSPGMRLSRPLYAFDGRQILSEDLVLDEDLILRIWQLCALRPLNAPVVVQKTAKEQVQE